MSLKRSKVNSSEEHVLEMLDPFVQLLIDCLKSMDVKVQFFCQSLSVLPVLLGRVLLKSVSLQLICKRRKGHSVFKPDFRDVQIKLFEDTLSQSGGRIVADGRPNALSLVGGVNVLLLVLQFQVMSKFSRSMFIYKLCRLHRPWGSSWELGRDRWWF